MATWRKLLSYRGSWPLPPAEGLSRAGGGGLDQHSVKKGPGPAAMAAGRNEGEAALGMAFIQQWGRG